MIMAFAAVSITACSNKEEENRAGVQQAASPDTLSSWTTGIVHDSTRIPADTFSIVRDVRTESRQGFDRIVIQFSGRGIPGFHIEYVDEPVHECGSGRPVELEGNGWLMIKFLSARMHEAGQSAVPRRILKPQLPVLLRLTTVCDFENYVAWIASVKIPNRFQVLALDNPPRLVVDIRH